MTEGLSLNKAKWEARFFAIASAVLLAMVLLIPSRMLTALLILPLVCAGWMFFFHGSTVVSMLLQGARRTAFQIGIALVVPCVLSLYFIQRTPDLNATNLFGHMLSPWSLIPLGIIGYISWEFGDQLDKEHPFRGFLIASAALFFFCILGYWGIHSEYDGDAESSFSYIDKEAAALATQSGNFFGQFLTYVAVAYAALIARFRKRRR